MPYLPDVADFLANGPLCVAKAFETGAPALILKAPTSWDQVLPKTVSRECEKCQIETKWMRTTQNVTGAYPESGGFCEVIYVCRNCGVVAFRCYIRWAEEKRRFLYIKVGQFPKFEIAPPKDLEKALSAAELNLYKRGKT